MKSVAVHDGKFHADEVFAVAILQLIHPDLHIIRTRDEQKLKEADARVDVGQKYDLNSLDFDHHQQEGAGERENGVPYASVGLIWKHYGRELVLDEEAWRRIDESLIQPLDADDVGMRTYEKSTNISVYPLPKVIARMNANWKEGNSSDEQFFKALAFAKELLQRELVYANNQSEANNIVNEAIENRTIEAYVILPKRVPWKEIVAQHEDILYVIYPGSKQWCVTATEKEQFISKKPFPKSWRGLEKEKLMEVTGLSGADFCHNAGFFFAAQTKEDAIAAVELSLETQETQ